MSVYAKPGIAQDPLHCPIKLTGIDPSKIVYINKSPPALPLPSMSKLIVTIFKFINYYISDISLPQHVINNQAVREPQKGFLTVTACKYFLCYLFTVVYKSDVAHKVMMDNIPLIKESQISLVSLANKLSSKKIINETERKEVTDTHTVLSADERMDKLLNLLKITIKLKGKVFGDFLEILREEDNVRADALADKLEEEYKSQK